MYTIVIADDEEELRQSLIRHIDWEEVGFEVVGEASNGAQALELVEKLEPDLLLSDIRMPYMSGIELARAVREIRPTMFIAFLSGYDDFSYAQQAIQYNIISYMLKPISVADISAELRKIRIKIDEKFTEFTKQSEEKEQQKLNTFLMPLLLDPFQEDVNAQVDAWETMLEKDATEKGLPLSEMRNYDYTVLVTTFLDEDGNTCTDNGSVVAVHQTAKKYLFHTGFYSNGKVISLLAGTPGATKKYLHILVEDIDQSVRRILNLHTKIGVSRPFEILAHCHEAYVEASKAFSAARSSDMDVIFISDLEQKSSGSAICDKALALIDEQYMNSEISLLSISNEISVSPNYLSALIKRSTGSTFINILTSKRMEKAKSLLLGTSMRINEIAEQCGYNDQHYFSYCFKKYEGISPNQCRRQNEKKESV